MTPCPDDRTLSQFLESELTPDTAAAFDQHLNDCDACQRRMDALTESHHGFTATDSVADPAVVSQLVARLSSLNPQASNSDIESTAIHFPGPPSPEAPLGRLGPYAVEEKIGDGASGVLYRATDLRVGREVAIKVLRSELACHEESRLRLQREARAVAALTHPNIVALFEVGESPPFPPYLVMEYVDGETLGDRLKRERPLAPHDAVDVIVPVARALEAAHETGQVHRDIKPSNILLDQSDCPKITDFGLALVDDDHSELTREGSLAGTPAYISPEQIIDPHNVDRRSDVYSLGVVLYQLLTGELPFQGVVRMTLLAVLHKEPPSLRQYNDEIPRDLETICLKALSKDPARRYVTAAALADDLTAWREDRPIVARPAGRWERIFRWSRRNKAVAALSGTVAGLLLVVTTGSLIASLSLSAARNAERESARSANRQRDQAFSTLNRLVFEVNRQFEDPGVSVDAIQRTILEISLRRLSELAQTADDAGLTDISTAAAHLRLGHVLTRLERYSEAKAHFTKADATLETLGGRSSDQWPVIRHMVESFWFRSVLAGEQEDYSRATELLRNGEQLAREAASRWPRNHDVRLTLGLSQSRLADHYFSEDDERAEEAILRAVATLKALEQSAPDDANITFEATNSVDTLATHYYETDQTDKAIEAFADLISRCGTALDNDTRIIHYANWLILAHHIMSDIRATQKQVPDAIRHLEEALRIAGEHEHWIHFDVINEIRKDLDKLRPPGSPPP